MRFHNECVEKLKEIGEKPEFSSEVTKTSL